MEWVKGWKLPPCEAIQYNRQPCHTMPELWDALYNTYNSAANQPCDLSVLDKLLDLLAQEWAPFSALELQEALAACSSLLSLGLDHVTWVHLKKIIAEAQCLNVFIKLANTCLMVGCWPKHFKKSVLVIILKPSKSSYSAPKAFRPIALHCFFVSYHNVHSHHQPTAPSPHCQCPSAHLWISIWSSRIQSQEPWQHNQRGEDMTVVTDLPEYALSRSFLSLTYSI